MSGAQTLSDEEKTRYARHLVLPEVGEAGQRKLKSARVLIVGLGGLGAPAALYLAAAGVGVLGLVDADTVALSNLQRQIIYTTADVGEMKIEVAAARLSAMNPHVHVNLHPVELTAENALNIFRDYDIILDGTDNFAAHYLINDAAVMSCKPLVWGNVERFSGQVGTVMAGKTACFRCLYPAPPPAGAAPSCEEIGVLGAVPGMVGSIQAMEVLKIILGIGEHDKILRINGATFDFKTIQTVRDENCAVCSAAPSIVKLETIQVTCAINEITASGLRNISPETFLLDVRNADEFAKQNIPGAHLIPLPDLKNRLHELDAQQDIIVYCKSGKRSAAAAELLQNNGFLHVRTLKGGIDALQLGRAA